MTYTGLLLCYIPSHTHSKPSLCENHLSFGEIHWFVIVADSWSYLHFTIIICLLMTYTGLLCCHIPCHTRSLLLSLVLYFIDIYCSAICDTFMVKPTFCHIHLTFSDILCSAIVTHLWLYSLFAIITCLFVAYTGLLLCHTLGHTYSLP